MFNIANTEHSELEKQLLIALSKPHQTIIDNGSTFDYTKSMFEQNIIDPLKVTRYALLNAVSVAKTILSTEAVVLNENEWRE